MDGWKSSMSPLTITFPQKLEEFSSHEAVASMPSEVTNRKAVKTVGLQTSLDKGGQVRVLKTRQKGQLPQTTEEFRAQLNVEGNTWILLSAKFRNRIFFRDLTPATWDKYTSYMLGEKVYLMTIPTSSGKGRSGQVPIRPPWAILLSYEYELRKEAVKRAYHNNRSLDETLTDVVACAQLKEQFFTSPIALQNSVEQALAAEWTAKRPLPADATWDNWRWQKKGKPKGKDKWSSGKGDKGDRSDGKGKGKGKLTANAPDGRQICFDYSTVGCDGSCGRLHICRVRGCGKARDR